MRPTFNGQKRTIETFLLSSFDGQTPKRIRLAFRKRVREERRFESPDALKAQILRDVGVATKFFRRTGVVNYGLPHSRFRTSPTEE
jgi:riboflavin kinase / FMN adenylyltransferase